MNLESAACNSFSRISSNCENRLAAGKQKNDSGIQFEHYRGMLESFGSKSVKKRPNICLIASTRFFRISIVNELEEPVFM